MKIEARYGSTLPELQLDGNGLRLRAFEPGDLALIEEASSDPLIPTITTVPSAFSPTRGARFIERQVQRRLSGEGWSLAILDAATQQSVGQVGLWISNLSNGRAELGYWVAPSGRGRGAAGRALQLLSDWALDHLDVARLSLFIEPWNTASIKTAEAAGFHQEALLTSWERVGGISKDMFVFARLPTGPTT